MAYVISEPCIDTKDQSCVEACPVDCIHPGSAEGDFEAEAQLYIDPTPASTVAPVSRCAR